jgi:hypothetical protein
MVKDFSKPSFRIAKRNLSSTIVTIYGDMFNYKTLNGLYLSSNNPEVSSYDLNLYTKIKSISGRYPSVSVFPILNYDIIDGGTILQFRLPENLLIGNYDILYFNDAGYYKASNTKRFTYFQVVTGVDTPCSAIVIEPTQTPTQTPTNTLSQTPTRTSTPTVTPTTTTTLTPTNTITPTVTPTVTPTNTQTQTQTPTNTQTPTPTITPTITPLPAFIKITDLKFSGDPEYITITNLGGSPQDMSGWYIYSHDGTVVPLCPALPSQLFNFPFGFILNPNQSVQIQSGNLAVNDPPFSFKWPTVLSPFIWNDTGDIGTLYNSSDELVDIYIYGNCTGEEAPTPTPTKTPTLTPTNTPTNTLSQTPTRTSTPTVTPTRTTTPTPTNTITPTVTPTLTPTNTQTQTQTPTNTQTPTPTQTPIIFYYVDFEGTGETKSTYGSGNVVLNGLTWNMTEALIGTLVGDYKEGNRSARLRGYSTSSIEMVDNKFNGIGIVSFKYRRYETDNQIEWIVECSMNDGVWNEIGRFTATDIVQDFNATVNQFGYGKIRIRTDATGSTTRRTNVDNILITGYV